MHYKLCKYQNVPKNSIPEFIPSQVRVGQNFFGTREILPPPPWTNPVSTPMVLVQPPPPMLCPIFNR